MLVPMNGFEWQVLRAVLRAKSPPTGAELRLTPSRRTKDGRFLSWFTAAGLLRVAGLRNPAARPFEARYALTPLGEHAAEFGEFECDTATLRELTKIRDATARAAVA